MSWSGDISYQSVAGAPNDDFLYLQQAAGYFGGQPYPSETVARKQRKASRRRREQSGKETSTAAQWLLGFILFASFVELIIQVITIVQVRRDPNYNQTPAEMRAVANTAGTALLSFFVFITSLVMLLLDFY